MDSALRTKSSISELKEGIENNLLFGLIYAAVIMGVIPIGLMPVVFAATVIIGVTLIINLSPVVVSIIMLKSKKIKKTTRLVFANSLKESLLLHPYQLRTVVVFYSGWSTVLLLSILILLKVSAFFAIWLFIVNFIISLGIDVYWIVQRDKLSKVVSR